MLPQQEGEEKAGAALQQASSWHQESGSEHRGVCVYVCTYTCTYLCVHSTCMCARVYTGFYKIFSKDQTS